MNTVHILLFTIKKKVMYEVVFIMLKPKCYFALHEYECICVAIIIGLQTHGTKTRWNVENVIYLQPPISFLVSEVLTLNELWIVMIPLLVSFQPFGHLWAYKTSERDNWF